MNIANAVSAGLLAGLCFAAAPASAQDADWKRGRIYYRSVCTSCHVAMPVGSINPSTRTRAEWAAYLKADKHGKDETVGKYLSKDYRAAIKAGNKAAEKFADVADKELAGDLGLFLDRGAKDGESPASCN